MPAPVYSHDLPHYFTDAQLGQLLRPINSARVGKDGKGFAHVEAYEIRAHLNRILGFARWSEEVLEQTMVFEDSTVDGNRTKWTVCYRSLLRLTVCDPAGHPLAVYTEGATGDATNMPSRADAHDMALKTSQSQAFKRAAMNLGDQFGLSLYNKGSMRPLVVRTLLWEPPAADEAQPAAGPDEHITTPLAPERDPEASQRESSSPAPSKAPSVGEGKPGTAAPSDPAGEEVTAAVNGPTRPMAGHDDPADLDGSGTGPSPASAGVTPAPTGGAPDPVATDPEEPYEWIVAQINLVAAKTMSPQDSLKVIHNCMELVTRYRLRERKMPDGSMTVNAALTSWMKAASAAIAAQAAAAQAQASRTPIDF